MTESDPAISARLWTLGPKRVFDFLAALILLLILSPLLIVTAVLVKVTSPGSVFFSQDRGGRLGRPFLLRKFRTMQGHRTPDPKELIPLDHPEITRLGRFLRRSKIDELPQLFNVLRGEMSIIGPRPTLLDQVEAYDDFRRRRLLVRPGVTGLAQVYANAASTWNERILYDIVYVQRHGLFMDLSILFRTFAVVLAGEVRMTLDFADSPYAKHVVVPSGYHKEGIDSIGNATDTNASK